MRNEKNDSLLMQWKAIVNPMDSCWLFQYSMCDNYTCYQGIPSTPMTMTTVGPGDTTDLKFSSNAFTHFSGTPVVKVLVWDMDIPSSVDTITYYITICPDSVACEYYSSGTKPLLNKIEVKVFPVPANDKINLKYPILFNGKISITDLSGIEIISIPAKGNSTSINIEWMTKGIYFIRISENNKIEFTQKFIKL
ncbi:hypothetical protein LBMAG27_19550 [Bacteroidota bacterium]|nr:hypothetical protein LBMAG27_19550 [Bacteroidota bacterium]